MKTIFKAKSLLLVFCFILFNCGAKSNKNNSGSYYDELSSGYENSRAAEAYTYNINTALFIGMLYVLSCPTMATYEYDIYDMVRDNEYLLHEDAAIIKGMKRLGNLMVAQGTQNFNFTNNDENNTREKVMDMANREGFESESGTFADKVASGMRNQQLQPVIIGNELIWLANVLPDAANGDWDGYENTGSSFRRLAQGQIANIKIIIAQYGKYDKEILQVLGLVLPVVDRWSRQYGMGYIVGCGISLGVFQ